MGEICASEAAMYPSLFGTDVRTDEWRNVPSRRSVKVEFELTVVMDIRISKVFLQCTDLRGLS
jgi:hypothetical protein